MADFKRRRIDSPGYKVKKYLIRGLLIFAFIVIYYTGHTDGYFEATKYMETTGEIPEMTLK